MITLQVSSLEVVTTGYLDPNGFRRGKAQVTSQFESRCQYGQRGQKSCTNSTLILTLEIDRQLLIISAMIERMRSKWDLPVPVIRQRRHRRYRFRPWLGRAEREEEGQYNRLIPKLNLDAD